MAVRDRLLGSRTGYSLFRKLIRADRGMKAIVDEYVCPRPGQIIVDLGCGTGDMAPMLRESITYIGVDHNTAYTGPQAALEISGGRHFINADLRELDRLALPPVDTAVAIGVLHHLSDPAVHDMLSSVARLLVEGGRLVTVDPVFWPTQASSARIMMAMDRGRYVRHSEHYSTLVHAVFPEALMSIREDLNPFPYTHCIFEATVAGIT